MGEWKKNFFFLPSKLAFFFIKTRWKLIYFSNLRRSRFELNKKYFFVPNRMRMKIYFNFLSLFRFIKKCDINQPAYIITNAYICNSSIEAPKFTRAITPRIKRLALLHLFITVCQNLISSACWVKKFVWLMVSNMVCQCREN